MDQVTNIFSTPIYHITAKKEEESNIEHLRKWTLHWEKKYKGIEKSNRMNGYHSVPTTNFDVIPYYNLLVNKIQSLPLSSGVQFTFLDWWINIQHRGDYNVSHNHPGSDLSFIWYLTDNYNSLIFNKFEYEMTRGRLFQAFRNSDNNPFNLEWTWKCGAGDLLIFPSDLLHQTTIHMHKKERICIAGNLLISTNRETLP